MNITIQVHTQMVRNQWLHVQHNCWYEFEGFHVRIWKHRSICKWCQVSLLHGRSGVTFINVLCTAFGLEDPKSETTQSSCQYLFTLLGSTSVKAEHRTLMKSTPDYDSSSSTLSRILWKVNVKTKKFEKCSNFSLISSRKIFMSIKQGRLGKNKIIYTLLLIGPLQSGNWFWKCHFFHQGC